MPEEIDTFSIIRAIPFERLDDRVPYKKLIIDNWDIRFTDDDHLEMGQIVWTAYAAISQAKTQENLIAAAFQRGTSVIHSEQNLPEDVKAEVYKRTKQDMKADEWPFAPLTIVAETAEKLRPFLHRRFSMDEMYPISQEVLEMFYGRSSQQEPPPQEGTIMSRDSFSTPKQEPAKPAKQEAKPSIFRADVMRVMRQAEQPPNPKQKKKHWWQR